MSQHRRSSVAALAALLVLASAACGASEDDASDGVASEPTTTTAAPTTTTIEDGGPVRIVTAGDSIMYDLAPAISAALDPSAAEVVELVTPNLVTEGNQKVLLDALDAAPTDLAIVMVGVWERGFKSASGLTVEDPGWEDAYLTEVLRPLAREIAIRGTHLMLVVEPPVADVAARPSFSTLAAAWQRLASERQGQVTVVESWPWLGPDPEFREVDEAGTRLRRTDGLHLCAAGAVRVANGVIELAASLLPDDWTPVLSPGWETAPWVERFPDDECPPSTPAP